MLIETTERTRLEADLALGTLEPLESRVTYIREADVQSLVGRGKTTKEIATVLSISTQTGRQRQDICRKLNLHSTPEVAA